MRIFLLLVLCSCMQLSMLAQATYATSNKKAIKLYEKAINYLDYRQYELAELSLMSALEQDDKFTDAKILLGQIFLETNELEKAKKWLKRVVAEDPNYNPVSTYYYANLELNDGNYEAAKPVFELFLASNYGHQEAEKLAQRGLDICEFAIQAIANPVDFDPKNMGSEVNSKLPEYFPAVTADESMLLFTRLLNDPRTPSGYNEDFYFCEKEGDQWGKAYNPGTPINSQFNEGAPTLSPDGKYIIFTSCEIDGYYGPGRNGMGSCDLFIAERIGKRWSRPRNMGRTINSSRWETQPSFASDGKTLYFIRGKITPGSTDADIYTSTLKDGRWTTASKLSTVINTSEGEESVFIHPDNQTLYFSSRGHIGMGELDIFMSRKDEEGKWTTPINLGYPINTHGSENSFHVSADGKTAFFGSDREGGLGDMDLYSFELPEELRPQPVTFLRGKITDAKTGKVLEARFELIDLQTNETVVQSYADESNGKYLVCIPINRRYALSASHEGYLFHSENFALEEVENITHYEKNIELQPIEVGRSVVLRNVFFDVDKFDLKAESKIELDRLAQLLNENPEIGIEISGHTDSQGNPDANLTLSKNRAKAVYEFLIEKGIPAVRLAFVGLGQTQPIASNDTAEGRAQNRRTEFKVVE